MEGMRKGSQAFAHPSGFERTSGGEPAAQGTRRKLQESPQKNPQVKAEREVMTAQ